MDHFIDCMTNTADLRICNLYLREDGILRIDIAEEEAFTLADAMEVVTAAGKLGNDKKMKNLIVVGNFTVPDNEAREYAASEEGSRYKIADAFVIHSLSQRIVGNFYLNFNKPVRPTKLFKSIEDAERWLESIS